MVCLAGAMATLGVAAVPAAVHAEKPEISVAQVYFELNNTDGDLGIHATVGATPWKSMFIHNHHRQLLFQAAPRGVAAWEGFDEISFESAEPTFDELDPAEFFRRYPEGNYLIVGFTVNGERMDKRTPVTHLLPAPPVVFVNNGPAIEDCDGPMPVFNAGDDVVIHWETVTHSHPEIGRINEPIEIESYEVAIEIPHTQFKSTNILPPDTTEFEVPEEILELADEGEVKYEVLVQSKDWNRTAIESCFGVDL